MNAQPRAVEAAISTPVASPLRRRRRGLLDRLFSPFTMTVYALDQSVRGSWLDRQRGYFNGPCVFALPAGRELEAIEVMLEPTGL